MGNSSSIQSLYQFQFMDFPDVYMFIARVQRGVLGEDFLRNITEKYSDKVDKGWEDSDTYTRCFIRTAKGYMEKRLRHPGRDYTPGTSMVFVDDEELMINLEGDGAVYKYFFPDQPQPEGHTFVLISVERIPNVDIMHEIFRTVSPMNHSIEELYARVQRKAPTIRNIEQVIKMEEAQKSGEHLQSASISPPRRLISLFKNDSYEEKRTEFVDGVAQLRQHITDQSTFPGLSEKGGDGEKRAELAVIVASVDVVLEEMTKVKELLNKILL